MRTLALVPNSVTKENSLPPPTAHLAMNARMGNDIDRVAGPKRNIASTSTLNPNLTNQKQTVLNSYAQHFQPTLASRASQPWSMPEYTTPPQTLLFSTIYHYGNKCANRFVNYKYFSNFLVTMFTFGLRISIIENVRSQNFIKN